MISQFQMVVFRKWRMTHNTDKHHQTGDVNDVCYDVVNPKVLNENLLLRRRDYRRAKLVLKTEINCLVAR